MTERFEASDLPAALAGMRLDRAVAMLTEVTRAEAAELVDAGAVTLGSRVVTDRTKRISEHDRITVDLSSVDADRRARSVPVASASVPFTVVFEDDEMIVIDKPPGVVVHPGAGNRQNTLVSGLLERYPELVGLPEQGAGAVERPGIVHRLDKDTSGLLVVARTPASHASLSRQLAERKVGRRYLAIVLGTVSTDHGVIDAPIGRSVSDPTRMAVSASGRHARTGYDVRERFSEPLAASYLELALETGRTHQIRVHLAAIDHPVLGDKRYGGVRGAMPVERFMLHAWKLRLAHPASGEDMEFDATAPRDFTGALDRLS